MVNYANKLHKKSIQNSIPSDSFQHATACEKGNFGGMGKGWRHMQQQVGTGIGKGIGSQNSRDRVHLQVLVQRTGYRYMLQVTCYRYKLHVTGSMVFT